MNRLYLFIIIVLCFLTGAQAGEIYHRYHDPVVELIDLTRRKASGDRPRIGLVLSGGGARGIAHVGVFKGLEKYDIPIDMIIGTSMGSVVGGFYAAGYSADELELITRSIAWDEIFQDATDRENLFLAQKAEQDRYLVTVRFDGWNAYLPTSLSSGQKILSIISDKLYAADYQAIYNFDNLKIPFRAVATDLISGDQIVISEGDLAEAINASTAVPLLFSPVSWEDKLLVDGGLLSNMPVDVAIDLGMDIVIAVDITSPLRDPSEIGAPWEIADQVTTIMMKRQYENQIDLADVVIRPDLSNIGSSDFGKVDTMITSGEHAVDQVIMQIREKIDSHSKDSSSVYKISDFRIRIVPPDSDHRISHELYASSNRYINYSMIRQDVDSIFSEGIYHEVSAVVDDSLLTYNLYPNPVVDTVLFSGNTIFADSVFQRVFNCICNRRLNFNLLRDELDQVQDLYRRKGFVLMRFRETDFNPRDGRLTIDIEEGLIDSISISGNEITEEYVILRDFPLKKNDVYNSRQIKRGIQNIYDTGLFERVSVNVDATQNSYHLIIKVKEKKFSLMQFGANVGSERGAQAFIEIGNENLFGIGSKLSVIGRYGEKDRAVSANYRIDRVLETYLTFGVFGYYDWKINPYIYDLRRVGSYREERLGIRAYIGQQIRKLGLMTLEFRIENVKDRPEEGEFYNEQNSELRTIAIRSVTDKRDRIAFTTSGIYNLWYWEAGNEQIFEGQEKFTKAFVNLEGYYTHWQNHTFHIRGGIGVGDKTLPFSEYFRMGGLRNFSGLHEYELAGRQIIYLNLEYQYRSPLRFLGDTYLGVRYDIGGIWEDPDLVLRSEDFFYGMGAWLGIDTILGPFLTGYGKTTIQGGVFYISLGFDF